MSPLTCLELQSMDAILFRRPETLVPPLGWQVTEEEDEALVRSPLYTHDATSFPPMGPALILLLNPGTRQVAHGGESTRGSLYLQAFSVGVDEVLGR